MSVLFALISLILGLHFLKDNLIVSIGLTLLFVIFIIYRFNWKKNVLYVSLFCLGALFALVPREYNNPKNIYSGVVLSSKENYFLLYSHGERFYVYEKNTEKSFGDIIEVYGTTSELAFTTYESQLDFNSYLNRKGVRRSITVKNSVVKFQSLKFSKIRKKVLPILSKNTAPLVDALVFNHKDYDSDVISTADSINLIFLLSTAGIYFSFFIRTLKKILFLKFKERESHILSLLIVLPYVIFSFPKVGVLRIYLLNIINIPKKESTGGIKSSSFLTKISIVHLFLLVANPYWAYDSGFLIGLSLTVFLYFFRISYRTKLSWTSKMVTPALVFLFIQPLMAFRSGSLHLLTFFQQLVLIPVNELFIILSFLTVLGIPIYPVVNLLGEFIYQALKLFQSIDMKIPFADYGDLYVGLFYLLFVVGLYFFESKRYRTVKIVSISALSLLGLGLIPIQPMITSGVYFINVGQGDSILIQDHFHAVMIDTGGNLSFDMAKESLIPFLNKKQIYHLDALITTHDDFDHSGAVDSLIKNFKVDTYLKERHDFPYSVGNIHLTNLNVYEAKEENDSSLVLYMDFYQTKYLFTGDAPKEIEKQIIQDNPNLRCDVLKVGHHGSKTSSDDSFIETIQPKEAVISCGKKNKFGHPNQEVLDTLYRYDVKIRRTDIEGTISYLSYFTY